MPENEDLNKKVSELSLDEVLKLISTLRVVLNKLSGTDDENGLIDQMLQANNLLEKAVLDMDGSSNGLKAIIELVENFKETFEKLSGKFEEFDTTFKTHEENITEYMTHMHNDELINVIEKFIEKVDSLFTQKVQELEQKEDAAKKHNFVYMMIAAASLIFAGMAIGSALLLVFFYEDIKIANAIKDTGVKIKTADKGAVFVAPATHTNLTKSKNNINMAVTFK